MSSKISSEDQFLWVSNSELFLLVMHACSVGKDLALTDEEKEYVARLAGFAKRAFPGISLDLGECFSSMSEKKWWARVFYLVARRGYLRTLEKQDDPRLMVMLIGDAYLIARMLVRTIQELEIAWHPSIDDPMELDAFTSGPIKVRS